MSKNKLKIFKISFLSFTIFSFFLFGAKIFAVETVPDPDTLTMTTLGYSFFGGNSYRFEGFYDGNVNKKELTYYFEYDTENIGFDFSSLHNLGTHTYTAKSHTIFIVQDLCTGGARIVGLECDKGHISDNYMTTQNLAYNKSYSFRAVAYFNGKANKKFYGQWVNLSTNSAFFGNYTPPYTVSASNSTVTPISNINPNRNPNQNPIRNPNQILRGNTPGVQINNQNNNPVSGSSLPSGEKGGLVGCGKEKNTVNDEAKTSGECGFNDILKLVNKIMHFMFFVLAIPIATIMFAYAGFLLIASGAVPENRSKAKSIFMNVAMGLIIATAGWLIIHFISFVLGYDGSWIGF